MNKVQIKNCTLYHADCIDVLDEIGKIDVVITDPPYGINMDKGFNGFNGFNGFGKPIFRNKYNGKWDTVRPSSKIFNLLLSISKISIIFGGNFFTDILPQGNHWIVWNKKNTMPTFGDAELIWTNIKRNSVKIVEYQYNGLMNKAEKRYHPTQKPQYVMRWIIDKYTKETDLILDPFMGSGSTGVACAIGGRKFIGIEKEKQYFDIACKRIRWACRQNKLF